MHDLFWIIDLIIPVMMIILSFFYKNKSKQGISRLSGFRTSETLQSQDAWKKAHLIASGLLLKFGIVLIGVVVLLKSFLSIEAGYLSLLNNAISIMSFVSISIYVNSRVKNEIK